MLPLGQQGAGATGAAWTGCCGGAQPPAQGRGNGDGCTADAAERSALDKLGTAVRTVGHGAQFRNFARQAAIFCSASATEATSPAKASSASFAVQFHVLLADHAVQRIDAVFLRRNLRVEPRDVRQVLALLDRFRAGIGDFLAQIIKKAMSFSRPFWKFSLPIIIQIAPYFVNAYWDFLEGKCS